MLCACAFECVCVCVCVCVLDRGRVCVTPHSFVRVFARSFVRVWTVDLLIGLACLFFRLIRVFLLCGVFSLHLPLTCVIRFQGSKVCRHGSKDIE